MYQETVKAYRTDKANAYEMYLIDPASVGPASFETFCKAMDRAVTRKDAQTESDAAYDAMVAQYG